MQMERGLLTIKGEPRVEAWNDNGRYSRVERMHGACSIAT